MLCCVLYSTFTHFTSQSISLHLLPIFSSVTLCISGIPDILRRTQINKLLTQNGGTYVKALERPVKVTHLLCSGDVNVNTDMGENVEPTDKMHYAEKFNRSGEADIKLVWEEWFWDCLEFGGGFHLTVSTCIDAILHRSIRRG